MLNSAARAQNRFLVVFGGGSVAHCYNDVVVLDAKTNEWSAPQTSGTPPTPRAGAPPRTCTWSSKHAGPCEQHQPSWAPSA